MKALSVAAACALLFGATAGANGDTVHPYVVTMGPSGPNVLAIGSGEFDLSGLSFDFNTFSCVCMHETTAQFAYFTIGNPAPGEPTYRGVTGLHSFGTNPLFPNATSGTGDPAGIFDAGGNPSLLVPPSYQSGTLLNSSALYANATLASLGLTPGSYVWTWGPARDQSFTLNIVTTTVPLPAALPLFATGLGALGLLGRRRKRRARVVGA